MIAGAGVAAAAGQPDHNEFSIQSSRVFADHPTDDATNAADNVTPIPTVVARQ